MGNTIHSICVLLFCECLEPKAKAQPKGNKKGKAKGKRERKGKKHSNVRQEEDSYKGLSKRAKKKKTKKENEAIRSGLGHVEDEDEMSKKGTNRKFQFQKRTRSEFMIKYVTFNLNLLSTSECF